MFCVYENIFTTKIKGITVTAEIDNMKNAWGYICMNICVHLDKIHFIGGVNFWCNSDAIPIVIKNVAQICTV